MNNFNSTLRNVSGLPAYFGMAMALLTSLGGLSLSAQKLTSFSDGMGRHVFYVGLGDGHVHQFYSAGNAWVDQDLTAAVRAMNAPGWSPLASFADKWGEHVFYVTQDLHINQLYWNGGGWVNQDLTAQSGGAGYGGIASGGMTAFSDGAGEHVLYVDGNQHVNQLFFAWGGAWVSQDLTRMSGGPAAHTSGSNYNISDLAAFSDNMGEHVFYVAANQHLNQLYFPWGGAWTNQDLNQQPMLCSSRCITPPQPWLDSGLSAMSDSSGEHVFYISGTYAPSQGGAHIWELTWNGLWSAQDLMYSAFGENSMYSGWNGMSVGLNMSLSTFTDGFGTHVFYNDRDGNLDQLYAAPGGGWVCQYALGPSTLHFYSGGLTSFSDSSGEYVFLPNGGGEVFELLWNGSSAPLTRFQGEFSGWSFQDLTFKAGGVPTCNDYSWCG